MQTKYSSYRVISLNFFGRGSDYLHVYFVFHTNESLGNFACIIDCDNESTQLSTCYTQEQYTKCAVGSFAISKMMAHEQHGAGVGVTRYNGVGLGNLRIQGHPNMKQTHDENKKTNKNMWALPQTGVQPRRGPIR